MEEMNTECFGWLQKPTSKLENFFHTRQEIIIHIQKGVPLNEPTKWTKNVSRLFFFGFRSTNKSFMFGDDFACVRVRGFRNDGKIVHLRTVKTIIS
jgi:hypothetical protein